MIEYSDGYFITEDGKCWSQRTNKFLKSKNVWGGYPCYCVKIKGKFVWTLAHRMVAELYIPNPNNNPLVCHKDDDPSNCHVNNLYWGTKSSNLVDAYRNGKKIMSEDQKKKMQEARHAS